MALRQNQHTGRELDLLGQRGDERQRQQRIGNRDILAAGNLAARRIWIRRLVVLRDDDVLDRPQRLDTASLGRGREMSEQSWIGERSRIYKHQAEFHFYCHLARICGYGRPAYRGAAKMKTARVVPLLENCGRVS